MTAVAEKPVGRQWWMTLILGIDSIIVGGLLLFGSLDTKILIYPVYASIALPQIFMLALGLYGVFEGIMLLIMAFQGAGWGAGIMGVIAIVLGGILVANYGALGWGPVHDLGHRPMAIHWRLLHGV